MRRDRVAGTIVRLSEGNISKPPGGEGGSRAFCPSSRAFSLFQRGDRMIKLPIDSHLFSSPPPPPVRPLVAAMRGTRCYQATTKRERAAQSCLRIDLYLPFPPYPQPPPLARRLYSSLLSVFDVSEIRLSNMPHVGFV